MIIPRKLRALVENYLLKGDRTKEMGGFFFGEDENVTAFLPIPNYSETPRGSYSLGNTKPIAEHFARMVDGEIIGDMHTHPSGSVPSEGDKGYVNGISWKFHVIIADKGDRDFEWFTINRKLQSIPVVYSDVELSAYGELLAREIGLKPLGRLFISPSGELLGREETKKILEVDVDTLRVLEWDKALTRWDERTMAKAQRDLNMTATRVKKAFKKLELGVDKV